MSSELIRDRAWVARQLAADASVTALAKQAGVSRQSAHTWLARHGLHGKPQAKRRPGPARLRTLYLRHGTVANVAKVLDVAPGTAHRWLIDAGVPLAAQRAPRRLHRPDDLAELHRRRTAGATHAELAAQFGVSPSTIRRRLAASAPTQPSTRADRS